MFWALVGIGVVGAVVGTATKVQVVAAISAILVLVAPLALTLAGHSALTMKFRGRFVSSSCANCAGRISGLK